jgi:hypothetical protein
VQQLHDRYCDDPEVTVLMVHTGWLDNRYEEPAEPVRRFVDEQGYSFAVAMDAGGRLTNRFGGGGSIPRAYVVAPGEMVRPGGSVSLKEVPERVEALREE